MRHLTTIIAALITSLIVASFASAGAPTIPMEIDAGYQQLQELQPLTFQQGASAELHIKPRAGRSWLDLDGVTARWEARETMTTSVCIQASSQWTSNTAHTISIPLNNEQTGTAVTEWSYCVIIEHDGEDYPLGTGVVTIAASGYTGGPSTTHATTTITELIAASSVADLAAATALVEANEVADLVRDVATAAALALKQDANTAATDAELAASSAADRAAAVAGDAAHVGGDDPHGDRAAAMAGDAAHAALVDNPHAVTAEQVGLGAADNTPDMDKPVSTAVGAALDLKQDAGTAATDAELAASSAADQAAAVAGDAAHLAADDPHGDRAYVDALGVTSDGAVLYYQADGGTSAPVAMVAAMEAADSANASTAASERAALAAMLKAKDARIDAALTAESWARMMGDAASALPSPGYYWSAFSSITDGIDDAASENHNYDAAGDYWYSEGADSWDLSDDLVAHYKLNDDAATTVVVDETGDNSATLTGGTTADKSATGKINAAIEFDGAGDFMDLNAQLIPASSDFSISGWVKVDDFSNVHTVVGQYAGGIDGRFSWDVRNDTQLVRLFVGGTGGGTLANTTAFTAGEWEHVALTRNGNLYSIYFDGELENTATFTVGVIARDTFLGITDSGGVSAFDGAIDDFRFWGRAITAAEVASLYNSGDGTEATSGSTAGADMSLISTVQEWDAALTNVTAYALTDTNAASSDYSVSVSLDEGVTWARATLDQPQGYDGTYWRYSGTTTVSAATVDEMLYRIETTNSKAIKFPAIGIIGDME